MKTVRFILMLSVLSAFLPGCTADSSSDGLNQDVSKEEIKFVHSNVMKFLDIARESGKSRSEDLRTSSTYVSPLYEGDYFYNIIEGDQSILRRTGNTATVNVKASNYSHYNAEGHAVTLWIGFVTPDYTALAAMYRLGGHVVGKNGTINISGSVKEGQERDRFIFYDPDFEGPIEDIDYPVVVVVKTHGPAEPNMIHDQISTLEGGCEGDPDGPGPLGNCYEFLWGFHL